MSALEARAFSPASPASTEGKGMPWPTQTLPAVQGATDLHGLDPGSSQPVEAPKRYRRLRRWLAVLVVGVLVGEAIVFALTLLTPTAPSSLIGLVAVAGGTLVGGRAGGVRGRGWLGAVALVFAAMVSVSVLLITVLAAGAPPFPSVEAPLERAVIEELSAAAGDWNVAAKVVVDDMNSSATDVNGFPVRTRPARLDMRAAVDRMKAISLTSTAPAFGAATHQLVSTYERKLDAIDDIATAIVNSEFVAMEGAISRFEVARSDGIEALAEFAAVAAPYMTPAERSMWGATSP